ncbi:hypothetical protein ACQPZQ_11810 [Pseudonocardia sp. CA-142604]|uniref:hypothetical protein n=1 Tax=Pseudonocardia sp. CA-142604 TaxID=3240024 RepID=UPI003D89E31F
MSTPVGERTRTATRSATPRGATRTRSTTIPAQRGAPVVTPRTGEPSSLRGRRSPQDYAGREDRPRRAPVNRPTRTAVAPRRPQFVLLVMVLLAVGLVATLWLSTAAAGGSYHLQSARAAALALSQQSERLHREVADLESAPELARRAEALGMVPVQDSARLVVAPDGSVTVVGQPRAAVAPPPPPLPPAPVQPAPSAGQQGTPAAPAAGGSATANDSAASDDSQESATGAQGGAAGTQGQSAGDRSDASTGDTQGGASTQGVTGGASTSGATGGTSTTGTSGDDSSTTGEGATTQGTSDDASTAGTSGGASTQGATGGATQRTTGGTSTQGAAGADGTGNG